MTLMTSEAPPLIQVENVTKTLTPPGRGAITVLKEVSLTVHEGEIVAVLGKSGCGKSTLLRIACGLTRATHGRVLYRGRPVNGPAQGVSLVFQSFALFPWLNTLQNVELGLEAQGVSPEERRRRSLAAIDMIGLDGFESAYPKELSGGMRQRVGFARALVVNPDVLLMDEAFSALDVPTAEALRNDLLDLWIEHLIPTRAILMVSHSIEEALLFADRVVVFDSNPGRVKAEVQVPLRHPRDREAPAFRVMVDRIYDIMTAAPSRGGAPLAPEWIGIAHRLPSVAVGRIAGALEELNRPEHGGKMDLAGLSEAMQMEMDGLLPIVEALELLDFARASGAEVSLTPHGQAFIESDIQRRKLIFAEHLLKRVPLASHIRRVLDERPSLRAPESRFLRELEDYLTEEEARRVLRVMIEWGRYAELLAYDSNSGHFSLENPGEEKRHRRRRG